MSNDGFLETTCPSCGAKMLIKNGTCSLCLNCGSTTGCSYIKNIKYNIG